MATQTSGPFARLLCPVLTAPFTYARIISCASMPPKDNPNTILEVAENAALIMFCLTRHQLLPKQPHIDSFNKNVSPSDKKKLLGPFIPLAMGNTVRAAAEEALKEGRHLFGSQPDDSTIHDRATRIAKDYQASEDILCCYKNECGNAASFACNSCNMSLGCPEHIVQVWNDHLLTDIPHHRSAALLPTTTTVATLANQCIFPFCLETTTKLCSRCKQVHYCSIAHQTADWPVHRTQCSATKTS